MWKRPEFLSGHFALKAENHDSALSHYMVLYKVWH